MSFSDMDLQRLKETLANPEEDLDWMYTGPQGDKFSALLCRLEAAEKFIHSHDSGCAGAGCVEYKAWRKSKGE